MPYLGKPFYPSDQKLAYLAETQGIESTCLEETFYTRRLSKSLTRPLASFMPDLKISGRQWLIQAPKSAKVSLQSGLLRIGNQILYESSPANQDIRNRFSIPFSSYPPGWWHRTRSSRILDQPLVLLTTHNNPNYFHWLTQPGLAPLFLKDNFNLSIPGMALALSHRPKRSLPKYVSSILQLFAPEVPLIEDVALTSSSLCLFSLQEHLTPTFVSPAQILWLQRRCRDGMNLSSTKPWRRVLISRKRSRRRRCLNEDQLFGALASYGFERIFLEDLSVLQQLRLFSESLFLVGVHGAGLANLVACAPHSTVIELVPRIGNFSHYYAMAEILGLNHGHILSNQFDPKTDNFTIEIRDLTTLVQEMIPPWTI